MTADQGYEVLIPARGPADILGPTLDALDVALQHAGEPAQVRVLVNGSAQQDYAALRRAHPRLDWQFCPRALGYHDAIARLLQRCQRPWAYLLNSDMRLHHEALARVLALRADGVFSVASQIFLADPHRRREETGFTVPVIDADGQLQLHDLLPPDDSLRSHLYGGGGATLFRCEPLRRYLKRSACYAPFYFEDAEWGVQAWVDQLECLFCPQSQALHLHRATIGRYHGAKQVERVMQRNLAHFRWRHGDRFGAPRWQDNAASRLAAAQRQLLPEHRAARASVQHSAVSAALSQVHLRRSPHWPRFRPGLPRALLVSPFDLLPPAHGGARRIVELARASAHRVDWIALHDEGGRLPRAAQADDAWFREIIPVGGRPADDGSLAQRWQAHAHPAMRAALAEAIARHRPQLLCFEHIESIGLIESLPVELPVLWTLHDAGRDLPAAARDRVQRALQRVDALVLTTAQDLGYWLHANQRLVENGARAPQQMVAPPASGCLLLVAPLRYRPNLHGLRAFLSQAWAAIQVRHPQLRLRVLGGLDARQRWGEAPLPDGVDLIEGWVDPTPHYAECLLALNPQHAIEGAALKIAEALAHGRVVLSTREGARGYETLDSPALQRVDDIADMADTLLALLDQPERLRTLSAQAAAAAAPWSWSRRGGMLADLVERMVKR